MDAAPAEWSTRQHLIELGAGFRDLLLGRLAVTERDGLEYSATSASLMGSPPSAPRPRQTREPDGERHRLYPQPSHIWQQPGEPRQWLAAAAPVPFRLQQGSCVPDLRSHADEARGAVQRHDELAHGVRIATAHGVDDAGAQRRVSFGRHASRPHRMIRSCLRDREAQELHEGDPQDRGLRSRARSAVVRRETHHRIYKTSWSLMAPFRTVEV